MLFSRDVSTRRTSSPRNSAMSARPPPLFSSSWPTGTFSLLTCSNFCGKSVCKKCLNKRRPDPQDATKVKKLCQNCNNRYLSKLIFEEYQEKQECLIIMDQKINGEQASL